MGKDSSIQWTDHTFNPWRGCTKVSPGCTNCYAEVLSKRNPKVLGVWGPQGTRVVASESKWREPLAWDREAARLGERKRVFCASLADVFEDWDGFMSDSQGKTLHVTASNEWKPGPLADGRECGFTPVTMDHCRDRLFDLILATPNLDWLILTKRPERWRRCWPLVAVPGHVRQNEGDGKDWQRFPNLWMGTTAEDQKRADERNPHLLRCPAAVRFLSVEPMLGPIDLNRQETICETWRKGLTIGTYLDWVICGGESGSHARPFDLAWARDLRDQCKAAGVAFFMKQMGSNPFVQLYDHQYNPPRPAGGMYSKYRDSHGGDIEEFPEDLRVREFPKGGV